MFYIVTGIKQEYQLPSLAEEIKELYREDFMKIIPDGDTMIEKYLYVLSCFEALGEIMIYNARIYKGSLLASLHRAKDYVVSCNAWPYLAAGLLALIYIVTYKNYL
jgi:hypothetical protein